MNHIVITILQHLFLAVGLVMLVAAWTIGASGAWVLALLGGVFATFGGGLMAYRHWSHKEAERLRREGMLVHAAFQRVEVNEGFQVNGENPMRIVAQWHDAASNRVHVFKSANLWFDPSEFVGVRPIPVYVDRARPGRYHMDLSFLPQVQR